VRSPGTPATPLSPSDIHPAYAASPTAASKFRLEPIVDSTRPQLMHSAISFNEHGAPPPYSVVGGARGRGQPHPKHALKLLSRRRSARPTFVERLDSPHAWLALYFAFNLGLTLFNKLVLQGFPFPWTLTALQMLAGTVGTQVLARRSAFPRAHLTSRESVVMLVFSSLYTVNIAVSNLSLHLVSVPVRRLLSLSH